MSAEPRPADPSNTRDPGTHDEQIDRVDTPRAAGVTFEVPAGLARHAELIAEFTSWTPMAMDRLADGRHRLRVVLPTGRAWGYQYVLDDRRIVNDPHADEFVPGPNGGHVSVVRAPVG
jgi:1,4-alpha-glucan branching enzyme